MFLVTKKNVIIQKRNVNDTMIMNKKKIELNEKKKKKERRHKLDLIEKIHKPLIEIM